MSMIVFYNKNEMYFINAGLSFFTKLDIDEIFKKSHTIRTSTYLILPGRVLDFAYKSECIIEEIQDNPFNTEVNYYTELTLFLNYLKETQLFHYELSVLDYDNFKEIYFFKRNTLTNYSTVALIKIINFDLNYVEKTKK